MIEYVETYCWIQGIIPIHHSVDFPMSEDEWKEIDKSKMVYYQWIPFVLIAQGIMCYLPHIFWRLFHTNGNNKDFQHIISRANSVNNFDVVQRKDEVFRLAKALQTVVFQNRDDSGKSIQGKIQKLKSYLMMWKKRGILLNMFYIFIKFIYFINAIGQILLMQSFLSLDKENYTFFGTKILHDIINGKDWQVSLVFPRVGYCFAKIRQLGVTNYITAQCILPINMLNEKIYIFLWFWMLFLSIASLISFLIWTMRMVIYKNKTDFLKMYLKLSGDYTNQDLCDRKIKSFESYFLRSDGIFLLRMMASNAGDLITAEVVSQLWKIHTPKFESKKLNMKRLSDCFQVCKESDKKANVVSGNESRRGSF